MIYLTAFICAVLVSWSESKVQRKEKHKTPLQRCSVRVATCKHCVRVITIISKYRTCGRTYLFICYYHYNWMPIKWRLVQPDRANSIRERWLFLRRWLGSLVGEISSDLEGNDIFPLQTRTLTLKKPKRLFNVVEIIVLYGNEIQK